MKARTSEQLANAIEALVASYLDEVHQAAQQALQRSLCRPVGTRRPAKVIGKRPHTSETESKRRTAAELDATCDQLCALVRARPGESVVALAEEMSVPAPTLQRPMAKLRAEGRVRTVGERHQMRYFPAVSRTATAKG